jgi:hypothetical protein
LCFVFHCIAFDRSRRVASFRGNAGRVSLSERSGHAPAGQIGHIGRESPKATSIALDL